MDFLFPDLNSHFFWFVAGIETNGGFYGRGPTRPCLTHIPLRHRTVTVTATDNTTSQHNNIHIYYIYIYYIGTCGGG